MASSTASSEAEPRGYPVWLRYTAAVVATAAVTLVAHVLGPLNRHPYLIEWPAIIASACFGGLGPGLVASALSTGALLLFWIEPVGSLRPSHPGDVIDVVLYVVCALAMTSLIHGLHRARADERRARRSREVLLGIVAHDLRNPLGTISLATALLRRKPDDVRRLDMIDRAMQRMDRLIRDLVDASVLDNNVPLSMSFGEEDVNSFIGEAVNSATLDAAAKAITIAADLAPGLRARCDRGRMMQVLGNLLGNAVKFTPEGGRISVRSVSLGSLVRLEVTDTGPGIRSEDQAAIFARHWTGGAKGSGAGLGLFIARAIVRAHGGRLSVHSEPGHGTTFFITLPAVFGIQARPPESEADRLRFS